MKRFLFVSSYIIMCFLFFQNIGLCQTKEATVLKKDYYVSKDTASASAANKIEIDLAPAPYVIDCVNDESAGSGYSTRQKIKPGKPVADKPKTSPSPGKAGN